MTWQKKAAAPAFANLAEEVEAIVTGGPDGWVLPWLDILGNQIIDVNAFCTAGPETCPPLDAFDFLGLVGGGRLGSTIGAAGLGAKLACFARQRMFSAYCEQPVPATTGCGPDFFPPTFGGDWVIADVPAGTNEVFVGGGHGGNVQQVYYVTNHDLNTINWSQGLHWRTVAPDIYIDNTGRATATQMAIRINAFRPYAYRLCGSAAHTDVFTPPVQAKPLTAIPPTPRVYATIPDLGKELDNIENKLHWILDTVVTGAYELHAASVVDGPSVTVQPNVDIPLLEDASGFIVTVSSIGNQTDEHFGEPRQLHRLGRVVIGNAAGWGPPLEITVSPMLITNLPPGTDRIRVHVEPPATATVVPLARVIPRG